ncbi:MAG: hypothetical protein AAGB34_07375 [Planctomycetota bacterium]
MLTQNNAQGPTTLPQLQIVIGSLIAGPVMFLGVTIYLITAGQFGTSAPGSQLNTILPLAWLGLFLITSPLALVFFPRMIAVQARKKAVALEDIEQAKREIFASYSSATVIRAAFIEGPTLFAVVILLLTGEWYMLAAIVAGLALLAGIFPTQSRYDRFFDRVTTEPEPPRESF